MEGEPGAQLYWMALYYTQRILVPGCIAICMVNTSKRHNVFLPSGEVINLKCKQPH